VGEDRAGERDHEVTRARAGIVLVLVSALILLGGCAKRPEHPATPQKPPFDPGTAIVACGEHLDIGTPVVLWTDPIGFDAYSPRCRFSDQTLPLEAQSRPEAASALRYGDRSKVAAAPRELAALVRLAVVHYDAVGSSERCFRALHDNRGLSCHFLLDLDGTIYQTLDLRERAFHAKDVNDESVGIEVANIGAMSTPKLLEPWYGRDETGLVRNLFPAHARLGEQRRADVIPRPARQEIVTGTIHGSKFLQWDFTDPQYEALGRLLAGLSRALPRIRLEIPRDRRGRVPSVKLDDATIRRFEGILGHHHLDERKYDPGPAFDWERTLEGARRAIDERR
jgi:N-acetylmuramoyl-L-alanine amidase